MKILLTNYMETTAPGGISTTVRETAKQLADRGHTVVVFQPSVQPAPEKTQLRPGATILRVPFHWGGLLYGFDPPCFGEFERVLAGFRPDLLHVHGYHTLFSAGIVAHALRSQPRIPVVFTLHFEVARHGGRGATAFWPIYNMTIGRWLAESVDLILACSRYESDSIRRVFGVPEGKVKIVSHGAMGYDPSDHPGHAGDVRLVYAGYLLKTKGVQYALGGIAYLVNARQMPVHLTVIGSGPYERRLRSLSRKLGIDARITWKGFVPTDRLLKEIQEADGLLLLSESEAFGIVVAEALAHGTPAVVAATTALTEFLAEPGCVGVPFPPGPADVADAVLHILRKDFRVGPLSNRIRPWSDTAVEYEAAYKAVVDRVRTDTVFAGEP